MSDTEMEKNRRPIKARETKWAKAIAGKLAAWKIKPNFISCMSVFFAAMAGACYILTVFAGEFPRALLFLGAALFIQARLLCNLFDGMVAVEGGFKSKTGEIFNDFPDRVADPLILISSGYALTGIPHGVELGWFCGALSLFVTYVRILGKSLGTSQYYIGPMAKQHRMFIMTLSSVIAAGMVFKGLEQAVMAIALCIIALGCLVTIVRRTRAVSREIETR